MVRVRLDARVLGPHRRGIGILHPPEHRPGMGDPAVQQIRVRTYVERLQGEQADRAGHFEDDRHAPTSAARRTFSASVVAPGVPNKWKAIRRSIGYTSRPSIAARITELR